MGRVENDDANSSPQTSLTSQVEVEGGGKQLSKKIKILTAVVIFYGEGTSGCAFNTYGPVITSLQNKYDTDDATISKVFTILTACYLVGALAAGIVYNYVNRQLAVILILSTMAAMLFLTPHCPSMTLFFISAAVMGLSCGAFGTAQFVWMMEMMQKDCPPYVQGQHFAYAVGTNFAALVMAPFLDKKEDDSVTTTILTTGTTSNAFFQEDKDYYMSITGVKRNSEDEESSDYDKLFIPYTIFGLLVSVAVVCHILLFIFFRYRAPPPQILESDGKDDSVKNGKIKQEVISADNPPLIGTWTWPKLRIVLLSCCYFGTYQGMEMCTFQFFSKFGQNSNLHLSESAAAYVLTGMTAAFAVGRGIAIIAVFKIPLQLIICGNLVLVSVANVLLIGWAVRSLPVLWTSSILFGLGFSSMYASFCAFMERYLNFTNFTGSLMLVCGSGVAAIYPLVVGSFIEENPIVLSYTSFFSIAFLIFSFGCVSYLTHTHKTRY